MSPATYQYYAGPPLISKDDNGDDQRINSLLHALEQLDTIEGVNTVYWPPSDAESVTAVHEADIGLSSANLVLGGEKVWLIVAPELCVITILF